VLAQWVTSSSTALIVISAIGGRFQNWFIHIFLSYIFLLAKPEQENVG
jgi:hypothetical protein